MKAIIVEDEFLAQEELRYLQTNEVDVVFLDINIPSLDGVLLAQSISKFSRRPAIIFITAYKEHAVEAFELEPFDYIFKPYHEQRIVTMQQKLEANQPLTQAALSTPAARSSHTVNLIKDERITVTDINNLYYAAAQEKVTRVYTRREIYTMPMAITEFCARLPEDVFFRCHRSSYAVNKDKIREIVPWFNNTYLLRLNDLDFEVPVSRCKVKAFRLMMGALTSASTAAAMICKCQRIARRDCQFPP